MDRSWLWAIIIFVVIATMFTIGLILSSCAYKSTMAVCVGKQTVATNNATGNNDSNQPVTQSNKGGEINMDFGIYGNLAGVLKLVLIHIAIAGLLIGLLTYFLPSYLLPLRLLPKMLMGFISAGLLLGIRFSISWLWTMKTGEVITDLVLGTILANWVYGAFVHKKLFLRDK